MQAVVGRGKMELTHFDESDNRRLRELLNDVLGMSIAHTSFEHS
jgi:hypothetical protein